MNVQKQYRIFKILPDGNLVSVVDDGNPFNQEHEAVAAIGKYGEEYTQYLILPVYKTYY